MNTKLLLMRVAFGLAERSSELGGASDFVRNIHRHDKSAVCEDDANELQGNRQRNIL